MVDAAEQCWTYYIQDATIKSVLPIDRLEQ